LAGIGREMVGSFLGAYDHKISSTGRISLPSKFRDVLKSKYGNESLILIEMGDHLKIYPEDVWSIKQEKLIENGQDDPEMGEFLDALAASMDYSSLDNNGRLMISSGIRTDVGLDGDCKVTGNFDHMEIWPAGIWSERFGKDKRRAILQENRHKIR